MPRHDPGAMPDDFDELVDACKPCSHFANDPDCECSEEEDNDDEDEET